MNIFDKIRSRPIRRTPDRLLGGVCAGLAHRWGLSPAIVRILALLIIPVGGLGLLVYGLGWLFIPDYDTEDIVAERALRDPDSTLAAGIVLTLLGLLAFVPFTVFWLGLFMDVRGGEWFFILVFIVAVIALLAVIRMRMKAQAHTYVPSEPAYTAAPTQPFVSPEPAPKKLRKRKVTPAISHRYATAFTALALAGAALALLFTGRYLASILMALSVALGILALGVFLAGIRGKRATWLTALTWLIGFPTAIALAVSLVIPTRFLLAENLKVFHYDDGTTTPSLFYRHTSQVTKPISKNAITDVDTLAVHNGLRIVSEDVPVIYRLTRDEEALGPSRIFYATLRPWKLVHDGNELLTPMAVESPDLYEDVLAHYGAHDNLEPGDTIEVHSPAAVADPDKATVISIRYAYGDFEFHGESPGDMPWSQWLESATPAETPEQQATTTTTEGQ
ncbi:PspC domain-containing protein [Trueperella bialowiezensis]|uniref:Phage shock protein C n=1 Tax=Trueperella bialowiezensis TaxID=312285 RepID=A0A448PC57_9ACTO|nr:PspC domain-containing protein [Trueperella bialowiezensis]VEI12494.1 phage shock protein C [Trueperella bialowiezensis]